MRQRLNRKIGRSLGVRKKPTMEGAELHYPVPLYIRYKKKLRALVDRMTKETEEEILRLFESPKGKEGLSIVQDFSLASQARILGNKLARKYESLFDDEAWDLAQEMVDSASVSSSVALASSLKKVTGDLNLKIKTDFTTGALSEITKAAVAENVALIKSLPQQYALRVQGDVMRAISPQSSGVAGLTKKLKKYGDMSHTRAANIAEDQVRRTFTTINNERLKKVGVEKGKWKYNFVGQQSRELHIELDGTVFDLNNPPVIQDSPRVTGLPGQLPYCHCTLTPIFEFDDDED